MSYPFGSCWHAGLLCQVRIYLLALLFLGLGLKVQAQRSPIITYAGEGVGNISVPADIDPVRPKNLFIDVEFAGGQWTTTSRNAFLYATEIWREYLSSPVRIRIQVRFEDIEGEVLAYFSPPETGLKDFTPRAGATFFQDTWYDSALADFLAGEDLIPGAPDIEITFNQNQNWYFGTDAQPDSGQFDFVTVALHEIAHGLGITGSAFELGPRIVTGENGPISLFSARYGVKDENDEYFPLIYQRFLADPTTGIPDFLTNYEPGQLYDEVYDMITTAMIWGSGTAAGAVLFAPDPILPGSSISHLDELTYNNTPNALMTPFFRVREAVHQPGPLLLSMLEDMGWDDGPIVGIEDELRLFGFDFECWLNPSCPGVPHELYTPIPASVEVGEEVAFIYQFIDEEPTTTLYPSTSEWQLRALHQSGSYVLNNSVGQSFPWWIFTVSDLPTTGYNWLRNSQGQIYAELSFTIEDASGFTNEVTKTIMLDHPPTDLIASYQVVDAPGCRDVMVQFDASGADYFVVSYKPSVSSNWITVTLPPGQHSYLVSRIWGFLNYDFRVEAVNAHGSVVSAVYTRAACEDLFALYPLPADYELVIEAPAILSLEWVEIYRTDAPILVRSVSVNGLSNTVTVPVWDLLPGTYLARIKLQDIPVQGRIITVQ